MLWLILTLRETMFAAAAGLALDTVSWWKPRVQLRTKLFSTSVPSKRPARAMPAAAWAELPTTTLPVMRPPQAGRVVCTSGLSASVTMPNMLADRQYSGTGSTTQSTMKGLESATVGR